MYYIFKPLYKFRNKNYYLPLKICEKAFSPVEAWTCPAISADAISIDPERILSKLWVENLQNNCNLLIEQNEMFSLTEGDLITVSSNQGYDVDWPKLSNKELIFDLDSYSVNFQKENDEYRELSKFTVPNCYWKGFSSLLINTDNSLGQKLEPNHSIICYNDDTKLGVISGKSEKSTYLQFEYPISNEVGTNIEITSTDSIGNIINNSAYVFNQLTSKETYKYITTTGQVYLYFNSQNLTYPDNDRTKVQMPINLSEGEYLIPITGINDIPLTVSYMIYQNCIPKDETVPRNIPISVQPRYDVDYTEISTSDDFDLVNKPLKNFVNGSTVFMDDKYRFIYFSSTGENRFKIEHPELVSLLTGKSPKDMGWLNSDGTVATDTSKNFNILTEVTPSQDDSDNRNPKELGWYERIEDEVVSYRYSTDTTVLDKQYMEIPEYYVDHIINEVTPMLEFKITLPEGEEESKTEVIIVLDDIYKFKQNPNLVNDFDNIFEKIKKLDPDEYFNYTYIPKDEDLIEDPLKPDSFWDKNHICNNYTIAQLDTSDSSNIHYKFITK